MKLPEDKSNLIKSIKENREPSIMKKIGNEVSEIYKKTVEIMTKEISELQKATLNATKSKQSQAMVQKIKANVEDMGSYLSSLGR